LKNLVPIGRFSTLCRLTIPALRHYDELGLLSPAAVDPDSGYRYYSLAQAAEAERIRLLRSIEMPLDEIRGLLVERDPDAVRALLGDYRRRLAERVAGYERALAFLDRLIEQEAAAMSYEVIVREAVPQPYASVRGHVPLAGIGGFIQQACGEIFRHAGELGVRPAGPTFSIYHDPEFREDDVDVEVGVPLAEPIESSGRVTAGLLPGGQVASTMHPGRYDEIGPAYRALHGWMEAHGREGAGPPREVYLVGPDQSPGPSGLRTEVVWPLR
jgi:DNA-binding transcriptional MerR regulator